MAFLGITHLHHKQEGWEEDIKSVFKSLIGCAPREYTSNQFSFFYHCLQGEKIFTSDHSLIFGRIFYKENCRSLTKNDLENLDGNSIGQICQKYWGRFIYISQGKEGIIIGSDSVGKMEIYYSLLPDGNLIFSDTIQLIRVLAPYDMQYDESYLARIATLGVHHTQNTLYKEIKRLPGGYKLLLNSSSHEISLAYDLWAPPQSRNRSDEDFIEMMQNVLRAWMKPYKKIFLSFSGGLDSTALLYLLSHLNQTERKELVSFNFFFKDVKGSDETQYASAIANELGETCLIKELSEYSYFAPIKKKYLLNQPLPLLVIIEQQEEIFKSLGVDHNSLLINGIGGDHVFMTSPSFYSILDAWIEAGASQAYRSLKEIAYLYRESALKLLLKNIIAIPRHLLRIQHKENAEPIADWVRPEMLELSHKGEKKHTNRNAYKLPGKHDHIAMISSGNVTSHNHPYLNIGPVFSPFLSNPIVEWVLSIPSYKLYGQGYNRLPVRRAICQHFNTSHVWRRDKGNTAGHVLRGVKTNLNYVLDLCLSGYFASKGLINKDLLKDHILRLSAGDPQDSWAFIYLYCTEAFLISSKDTFLEARPKSFRNFSEAMSCS